MNRFTAWVAASVSSLLIAVLALSVLVVVPAAADPLASKRAEAAKITRQLEALARRASVLTEDYNEARVRASDLETRTRSAGSDLARVEAKTKVARTTMKQMSVQSYVRGGLSPVASRSVSEMSDLGRAEFFVRAAANRQKDALDELKQARAALAEQQASLAVARTRARKVLDQVASKRRAAAGAVSAQRALLASVKGDVARLVSAEQARRSLAAAARRAPTARAGRNAKPVITPPGVDAAAPNPAAAAAVAEAKRQLGKPYKWAGSGPDNFDCSGLTAWAWRVGGGRSLPHSSRAQYSATSRVPVSEIAPGDLLFAGSSVGSIHHVGIYVGGGQMIAAPETGRNVAYAYAFRRDLIGIGRVN